LKKLVTTLLLVFSLGMTLCACQNQNKVPAEVQNQFKDNVNTIVNIVVVNLPTEEGGEMVYYTDADREAQLGLPEAEWKVFDANLRSEKQLCFASQDVYTSAVQAYLGAYTDTGDAKAIMDPSTFTIRENTNGGYEANAKLTCELRKLSMDISYDENMQITNIAFNPVYTFGESMSKAGLNTLMGMGTVFVVLILIAFIISGFSLINKAQNASAKKKEKAEKPVDNVVAQIIQNEENLTDDLELIAVISAAIAAYEGSENAGDYVVRSIRRRNY